MSNLAEPTEPPRTPPAPVEAPPAPSSPTLAPPLAMPELAGPVYAPPKGSAQPEAGSIAAHCIAHKTPAWMHAALSAEYPIGQTFTAPDFIAAVRRIAGYTLGR